MIPTNADCIIYNRFGNKFIRYDIKDVFWDEEKGSNTIQMGTAIANSLTVFMDKKDNYIPAMEWIELTEEPVSKFTLQKGDMLIKATSEITDAPSEFPSDVSISKHFGVDYAHKILSIDEKIWPSRITSHFEIAGQ